MEPTPIEITIFATHKDEQVLVYRNIVLSVPRDGETVFYKIKRRRYYQTVQSVTWEFSVDKPYVRVKVQLK